MPGEAGKMPLTMTTRLLSPRAVLLLGAALSAPLPAADAPPGQAPFGLFGPLGGPPPSSVPAPRAAPAPQLNPQIGPAAVLLAPQGGPPPAAAPAPAAATPGAAPGTPPAGEAAPAAAPAASPLSPGLAEIAQKNVFDRKHQPWPDRVPPRPAPPPLTADDVQIYGIVRAGAVRRAVVKLGGKFKGLVDAGNGRPFATLAEGQQLGEYRLAEILPAQLVFMGGSGARQTVDFNKKNDRVAVGAPPPPVIQAAVEAPPGGAVAAAVPSVPPPGGNPVQQPQAPAAAGLPVAPPGAAAPASAAAPAPQPIRGNTLAEAIAAAQAAAAQGGQPAVPANPFAPRK